LEWEARFVCAELLDGAPAWGCGLSLHISSDSRFPASAAPAPTARRYVQVSAREIVPLGAMSLFLVVHVTSRSAANVHTLRNGIQVIRIHARRIAAQVIQHQSRRNGPNH